MLIASKRGISAILTFLGEFEIVTTGFAIVDFQSQLLIMKGEICSSDIMKAIKQSVAKKLVTQTISLELDVGYTTFLPLWCSI